MRKTLLLLKNPWQFLSLSLFTPQEYPKYTEMQFPLERLKSIRLQSPSHHHSSWISSLLAIALKRWRQEQRGFFFPNVWCSQIGDHPHKDLAKFGYGPGMKVKRFKRILLYFGNPTGTCSTDRAIWFCSFWNLMYYGLLFVTEIPCRCGNYFFKWKRGENLQLGRNDNQVPRLVGQNMADEIAILVPMP